MVAGGGLNTLCARNAGHPDVPGSVEDPQLRLAVADGTDPGLRDEHIVLDPDAELAGDRPALARDGDARLAHEVSFVSTTIFFVLAARAAAAFCRFSSRQPATKSTPIPAPSAMRLLRQLQ